MFNTLNIFEKIDKVYNPKILELSFINSITKNTEMDEQFYTCVTTSTIAHLTMASRVVLLGSPQKVPFKCQPLPHTNT